MHEAIDFVLRHGYALVILFVFAEQIGLPIPATPVLLAGGALVRTGRLDGATLVFASLVASVTSDVVWYELGRRKGARIMRFLCKISLEPDSCVRKTEEVFGRHGVRALVVAKFVPALNTAAPPMAGAFGMRRARFLVFDVLGSLLWLVAFFGIGWLFGDQIEIAIEWAERLGIWLGAFLGIALVAYIALRWNQRQRFLRDLRIARIEPEELYRRIESGEDIAIVDLRHSYDFEASPETLPGAIHIPVEALEEKESSIPRDRDVVLYCT